jgi:hypothetical protein
MVDDGDDGREEAAFIPKDAGLQGLRFWTRLMIHPFQMMAATPNAIAKGPPLLAVVAGRLPAPGPVLGALVAGELREVVGDGLS